MADKNLLLGSGQLLTKEIPTPKGGGNKKHPYSFGVAREALLPQLHELVERSLNTPEAAKPNGMSVAKLTLHPAYLAKSYFPGPLLNGFDFELIGSKSVEVSPRGRTKEVKVEREVTNCLYKAGTDSSFQAFENQLQTVQMPRGIMDDVRKIEELEHFSSEDKIRSLGDAETESKYEVALHTPYGSPVVLDAFFQYAMNLEVVTERDRKITTGGLTFLPILATRDSARRLSEFTFLRTLRVMPELRVYKPVLTRTTVAMPKPNLPTEEAQCDDISVAVFDGGVGTNDIAKWCDEVTYSDLPTSSALLAHGASVTSTILFGPVSTLEADLPQPYTRIDHHRVLDATTDASDPDLFDVVLRIRDALEGKQYQFVNFSIGPRLPIEDDDVSVWTSVLDPLLANGSCLATVAVGNDGKLVGQNRIQPPSDLVNGLAVGAATTIGKDWMRADYSCIGPGRSPGFIKPDGVAFGGTDSERFNVYCPTTGLVHGECGTSFAAPLVLRTALSLKSKLAIDASPLTIRALLIHHIEKKNIPKSEIGWGRFPLMAEQMLYCADDEVTVVYTGKLKPSKYLRAEIPFPDIELEGDVRLKATFCYSSEIEPEHPINYTKSGLVVSFRPKGPANKTDSFFNLRELYQTEQESRSDAHKWETTLHRERKFRKNTLIDPCFDIVYQAREAGSAPRISELSELNYVLVVTVSVANTPNVYNNIRQKYGMLLPIELRDRVQVTV